LIFFFDLAGNCLEVIEVLRLMMHAAAWQEKSRMQMLSTLQLWLLTLDFNSGF
jgi:hypothetical protein